MFLLRPWSSPLSAYCSCNRCRIRSPCTSRVQRLITASWRLACSLIAALCSCSQQAYRKASVAPLGHSDENRTSKTVCSFSAATTIPVMTGNALRFLNSKFVYRDVKYYSRDMFQETEDIYAPLPPRNRSPADGRPCWHPCLPDRRS